MWYHGAKCHRVVSMAITVPAIPKTAYDTICNPYLNLNVMLEREKKDWITTPFLFFKVARMAKGWLRILNKSWVKKKPPGVNNCWTTNFPRWDTLRGRRAPIMIIQSRAEAAERISSHAAPLFSPAPFSLSSFIFRFSVCLVISLGCLLHNLLGRIRSPLSP